MKHHNINKSKLSLFFMNKNPFISVVIPTYNRKNDLIKCLGAIQNIDYPYKNFEVIIIDDGSMDRTEEFMKSFVKKQKNIKYFKQKNSGPAKARNLGIKKSRGEIVFFVDDDVLVPKDLIKKSLIWYKSEKVGGVGGLVLPKKLSWPDLYYIARYLDEYINLIKLDNSDTKGGGIATALCSYRRKVLRALEGFNESFPLAAGEDIELTHRALENGWIIIKDPSIIGEHLRSETFKSVLKLKFKRMSGAVIHRELNKSHESPYHISRLFEQWKNFKKAKNRFIEKEANIIDLIKVIYLTLALALASKTGEIYFKRKLKNRK